MWDIAQFVKVESSTPVTVAERSTAWTVFARSETGIWVRIPHKAWIFGVCMCLFCLCCPVFRQRPCDELITRPRSPTLCKNDHETEKLARAHGDCKASGKKKNPRYLALAKYKINFLILLFYLRLGLPKWSLPLKLQTSFLKHHIVSWDCQKFET
jgi:hypothetical protein